MCRSQKPRLVFPFRQHDSYVLIPPRGACTTQYFVRELFRTIIVRVEQDQDATLSCAYLPGSQLDSPFQLAFFQYLVALHTNRRQRIHMDIR